MCNNRKCTLHLKLSCVLCVCSGDINRPELLKSFHVDHARACVLTLSDMSTTNKAVVKIRKLFPSVPIVVRAKNEQHQQRLENMFGTYCSSAQRLATTHGPALLISSSCL